MQMIEQNLIDKNITKNFQSHYLSSEYSWEESKNENYNNPFISNNEDLSTKNIKDEYSSNDIVEIIRNDEIEKLQKISTQTNFDLIKQLNHRFLKDVIVLIEATLPIEFL